MPFSRASPIATVLQEISPAPIDSEVPGLEIRVWPSAKKVWRLHYTRRNDGRRRAVGLGSYPGVSLKEARRKARRLQAEVEDLDVAADPAGERAARRQAVTFSDLAEDWVALHGKPNKSARALLDDLSMLRRHVLPEIGSMKVADISKRDVLRLLDIVTVKGDARAGLARSGRKMTHRPNRVFELARSIFRWAVSRDVLERDPTQGLKPPIRKEKARERDLSADEIMMLWAVLETAPIGRRTTKGLAKGKQPDRVSCR